MTEPDNMQRFNDVTSQIFALLYEEFPTPTELAPEHFNITQDLDGSPTWRDEDFLPIFDAINWLSDEGFLRFQGTTNMGFFGVVLSQKGLLALQAAPDALSGKSSLGDQMQRAVKSGAKQIAWKLVEQVIAYGFKQI